jgi:orotidine-5'-phosphate decarboxylase
MMSDHPSALLRTPRGESVEPRERLILALDFPSAALSLEFLEDLRQRCTEPPLWVKVGLELFLAEGSRLVDTLRGQGYSVFLDLKLHDIPNTVGAAVRALGALDVDLLTVHAAGGPAMLRAAAEAAAGLARPPRLLAVTVLTSMDERELTAIGVACAPREQVLRLAGQAWQAGIRGLVASPLEAGMLRGELGAGLHLVTPGIRPADGHGLDDQQRVATAAAALRSGASQLVVGRPITRAVDPGAAYKALLAEIAMVV